MFRENVLIALTILVTILALSYVILMTVYLQIHEMERKSTLWDDMSTPGEEAQQVNVKSEVEDEAQRQQEIIKRAEAFWNDIEKKESNAPKRDNDDEDDGPQGFQPFVFGRITFKEEVTTTTKAPEFGFTDSHGPPPPPDAILFPYHFYKDNGHLTLEVPDNPLPSGGIINDDGRIDISKVISRLQEFEMRKKIQEIQSRIIGMNGMGRIRPWYRRRGVVEDGNIWFKKEALENPNTNDASNTEESNGSNDIGPKADVDR